jgi:hypothetical protein
MDVWVVSAKQTVPLQLETGVVIESDWRSFIPLALDTERLYDGVIVYRWELCGVVILMSGSNVSLTVNGNRVIGGLYQIDSNSLVRLRRGQSELSLAVIFDDSVVDVPTGSACDICGKDLREGGKGHCRKKMCIECVETFGAKCPDCGRELLDGNTNEQALAEVEEYFME